MSFRVNIRDENLEIMGSTAARFSMMFVLWVLLRFFRKYIFSHEFFVLWEFCRWYAIHFYTSDMLVVIDRRNNIVFLSGVGQTLSLHLIKNTLLVQIDGEQSNDLDFFISRINYRWKKQAVQS